jgi:prepilin-type N-terminal cleavage/methylation domain-containing protein
MKKFKFSSAWSHADTGYSLIEVLISMAIFSIGILAVGAMIQSTADNTTKGNVLTQATMLARDKIEELKRIKDVSTLADGVENNIDASGNPGGIYRREWDISPGPTADSRQIVVSVSWTRENKTRSVVLTTLHIGI